MSSSPSSAHSFLPSDLLLHDYSVSGFRLWHIMDGWRNAAAAMKDAERCYIEDGKPEHAKLMAAAVVASTECARQIEELLGASLPTDQIKAN